MKIRYHLHIGSHEHVVSCMTGLHVDSFIITQSDTIQHMQISTYVKLVNIYGNIYMNAFEVCRHCLSMGSS